MTDKSGNSMDPRLKEAARTGNFSDFYSLIEEKASLLKDIDTESFAETPLHVAAAAGQIAFATEMMNLRPAFARTVNQSGFSPMHVALLYKKTQLVYQLLTMDNDLVRVKGREGKTPFHHIVEQGDEQLLNKFLEACPECIQDVTVHGDTAFHIALKCDKFETFELLVKWIINCGHKDAGGWEDRVLNWKDEQGNTLLHIAAIKNNLKAVRLLLVDCCGVVDVNARNLEDLTAEQYISQCDVNNESNENESLVETRSSIIQTLKVQGADPIMHNIIQAVIAHEESRIFKRIYIHFSRRRKNIREDMRNALLIVMTLIITATYQSPLNPPGGVWSGDNSTNSSSVTGELHHPGTTVMQKNTFSVLCSYNTLSLLMTIGLTLYILPSGPVAFLLFAPLSLLCSNYMLSMSILSPTPQWSKANRILSVISFMLLIIPSYIYIMKPMLSLEARKDRRSFWTGSAREIVAGVVIILVIVLSVIAFRAAKLF